MADRWPVYINLCITMCIQHHNSRTSPSRRCRRRSCSCRPFIWAKKRAASEQVISIFFSSSSFHMVCFHFSVFFYGWTSSCFYRYCSLAAFFSAFWNFNCFRYVFFFFRYYHSHSCAFFAKHIRSDDQWKWLAKKNQEPTRAAVCFVYGLHVFGPLE